MNTHETIEKFINQEFNLSNTILTGQTSLIQTGLLDSLGLLRLIAFMEETFQIRVSDEDVFPENFDTIDLITAYVASKR